MIYRLYSTNILNPENVNAATTVGVNPQISFRFAPDNTDYAQFKKAISEETAQLQDAEGTLMTAQAAKDFIKELP
jgi:hypothetical protein